MADRTITARLRLTYDEWARGTKEAAKGLRGIGDEANKTSKSVGRDWDALGTRVSDLGKSMTTRLTLPLVGLGVVATKSAADFDAAFTTMQTLAGVSGDAVAGMKDQILELAGETGKAPQELADAMYFLASSGLDADAAMQALTVSAKASAAGLGPTEVIADAVSSAMLGYAESGLEAAEATDVLIATARAGKAEPAELAAQMGRLIPTAAELGITFGDVGGAIAALSTKGNNAEAATTQLTNVMGKLLKPSQQAEEALEGVGLSTDRIRELIAEKGLLGTLEVLKERLGDSGFVKFFEDQQAVQGALALTGGDLNKTRDIFEQVNDSVGATDEAFATWAESMGAKNARAFADFQVALIRLGDVIAPIAADLLSFAAAIVSGFSDLPDPVQKLIIAFGALVAAVGPLLTVGGNLMKVWGATMKVLDNWTSAGGRGFADAMNAGTEAANNQARAMGGLRTVLAGAGIAGTIIGITAALKAMDDANAAKAAKESAEAFIALGEGSSDALDAMLRSALGAEFAKKTFDELRDTNAEAAERFIDQAEAAGVASDVIDEMRASLERKRDADVQGAADQEANTQAIESSTIAMADQEQAVNEAAEAYKNYADTIAAAVDPVFGLLNALRDNQEAQRGVTEAQKALDDAIKEHGRNSAEATEATIALQDAMLGVGQSALDVTTAAANLNAAVAENPALVDDALNALQTWRDQGIIPTDEQLKFLQDQIRRTALQGVALDEVDPSMNVTERGARRTREELRAVRDRALDIPTSRTTNVGTRGVNASTGALGRLKDALDRLHDRTVHVNVVLNDPTGSKLAALAGRRAAGGPVHKNRLYEVAEGGAHELLRSDGRTYLIPGSEGTVVPAGPMTSAASLAGGGGAGGDTFVFHIGVVGSQREFDRMVQRAFNVRLRKGRGLNAA